MPSLEATSRPATSLRPEPETLRSILDAHRSWVETEGREGRRADLEEFLRRSQDRLRSVLPGGSLGGKGLALILLAAVVIWGFSGFFRVDPDELGDLLVH